MASFAELINEVADRLNLTSDQAMARIGRSVNERYRWMASSIGLQTSVRGTVTATATIGSRFLTFAAEKLFAVYDASATPPQMLEETTAEQMRLLPLGTDPARIYAIYRVGSSTVTIWLNAVPTTAYVLTADIETTLTTLTSGLIPAFPEDFHDLLVYGAMATELDKMEKYDLAAKQEALYEKRLSDLRLFLAKTAYRDLVQGGGGRVNVTQLI